MTAATYYCPTCDEHHAETDKADFSRPILPDRCSAQYRHPPKPGGKWRVCHADFKLWGGPHPIGRANLCTPCWDRQMAPHIANGLKVAEDLVRRDPKAARSLFDRLTGGKS
jgi:hypothetical protein